MTEINRDGSETLGIANLNILYDRGRTESGLVEPQDERIDSIAKTLGSIPISLDLLMLQEVHVSRQHHNGESLADKLGLEQRYWVAHNRKGEHLGVCGNGITETDYIDIGDNRKAIVAMVGGIAFIGIHHRAYRRNGHLRIEQMKRVIDAVDDMGTDKVVIAGDSNDHPLHESRRMLADAGFTSAYKMRGLYSHLPGPSVLPTTFPTKNYRDVMFTPLQRRAAPFGVPIDILELRGFGRSEVARVGTRMTEKSDHKTLFAELAPIDFSSVNRYNPPVFQNTVDGGLSSVG